jgi:hypothetical protein
MLAAFVEVMAEQGRARLGPLRAAVERQDIRGKDMFKGVGHTFAEGAKFSAENLNEFFAGKK